MIKRLIFSLLFILVFNNFAANIKPVKKPVFFPPELIQEGFLPAPDSYQLLEFKGFWKEQDFPTDGKKGEYYISQVDGPKFKKSDFLIYADSWGVFSFRGQKGKEITSITVKPNEQDPFKLEITFHFSDDSTQTITTPNIQGEKGEQGIQGERGLKGDKGDPGQDGKQGPKGEDGKIQELTSKDGTVSIDNTDPAKPDLSVKGANPNKLIGFDLPKEIKSENNGQILAVDFKNKKWVFVDNKGGDSTPSIKTLLIAGVSPISATKPGDTIQINGAGKVTVTGDDEKKIITIKGEE